MADDHKGSYIVAAGSVIAALIVAVVGLVAGSRAGNLPSYLSAPPSTVTVTTTATVTQTTTIIPAPVKTTVVTTVTGQPPDQGGGSGSTGATTYLDQLDPIGDDLFAESVSWGSDTFAHSLVDPLSGCDQVGPVDWVIPSSQKILLAEIGVATDSQQPEARVTFDVYLDGRLAFTTTLAVAEHQSVRVNLGGAARLRLETIIDKNRQDSCSSDADAVWGNVRFAS